MKRSVDFKTAEKIVIDVMKTVSPWKLFCNGWQVYAEMIVEKLFMHSDDEVSPTGEKV